MQRTTRAFVLAVAGFGVAGRISAQPPDPLAPAPRPILETPVNFERAIRDEKLADVLRQLRDKYKCHISVDQAAFDKKGIKSVAEKTVTITKIIGAPLELVLEMVARQVDGTIIAKNGELSIAPGKSRALGTLAGVPNAKLAAIPVQIDQPVEGASLKDICEYLSDKSGPTIFIDAWAFERGGKKNVENTQCDLPAGGASLYEWLNILAKKIDGKVILGEGLILIVPAEKKR